MYQGLGQSSTLVPVIYGDSPPPGTPLDQYVNAVTLQRGINASLGGNISYVTAILGLPASNPAPEFQISGAFTTALNDVVANYQNLVLGPSASAGNVAVPSSHVYGIPPAPITGGSKQAIAAESVAPTVITVVDLQRAVNLAASGDISETNRLLNLPDLDPLFRNALKSIAAAHRGEGGGLPAYQTFYRGEEGKAPLKVTTIKIAPPPKFEPLRPEIAPGVAPSPVAEGAAYAARTPFTALLYLPPVARPEVPRGPISLQIAPTSPLHSVSVAPIQADWQPSQYRTFDARPAIVSPLKALYDLLQR